MAARNTTLVLVEATWTLLADNDVTAIRVQNQTSSILFLQATVGASAPSSNAGTLMLFANQTLAADLTLAQLWPGVAGTRVYGKAAAGGDVSVSHAA